MKSSCDNPQKMPWSSSEEAHLGFSLQGPGKRISSDQQAEATTGAGCIGQSQSDRLCFMSTAEMQIRLLNKVCQQPHEREQCLHKRCCFGSFSSLLPNYSNHAIYFCKRFQFPKNS